MINRRKKTQNEGFSLIEILIVMVVTGLVVASVYSLFIHSQRTANTSEEVVDVQQNLRVAVDTLVADIRMSNFLLIDGEPAIVTAPDEICDETDPDDSNTCDNVAQGFFELRSSTSMKSFARVVSVDGDTLTVEVGMEANFSEGDEVAVINPLTAEIKKTSAISPDGIGTGELTLNDTTGIDKRDIIVRKPSAEDDIAQIRYWLRAKPGGGDNNFELMRNDAAAGGVIATNISELDLTYIMNDGTEENAPTNLGEIRAIRIAITGQTDNTRTGLPNYSGVKNRSLETVAKLRNN